MQRLARKRLHRVELPLAEPRAGARAVPVHGVTHQRMPEVRHVHADLVGAAGLQRHLDVRRAAETLQHAILADRGLARGDHRHLLAVARVAPDRRIHRAARDQVAGNYRLVHPSHFAALQLLHQAGMGAQAAGDHHHAGSFLVEPVHDARAR